MEIVRRESGATRSRINGEEFWRRRPGKDWTCPSDPGKDDGPVPSWTVGRSGKREKGGENVTRGETSTKVQQLPLVD